MPVSLGSLFSRINGFPNATSPMSAPRIAALLAALIAGVHADLAAQQTVELNKGTRVRLVWSRVDTDPGVSVLQPRFSRLVGTVVTADVNRIVVVPDGFEDAYYVPVPWLLKVEVSQKGESAALGGAGIGMLVGVLAGALWGLTTASNHPDQSVGERATLGMAYFALPGTAVGYVIGLQVRIDEWVTVPLADINLRRPTTTLRGNLRLGVRLAF